MQETTLIQKCGSVFYSIIGLGGGYFLLTAPYTERYSMALYGCVAIVCSLGADFIHNYVKEEKVKTNIMNASETLLNYSQTCIELYQRVMINDDLIQININFLQQIQPDNEEKQSDLANFILFFKSIITMTLSDFKKSMSTKIHIDKLIKSVISLEQWINPSAVNFMSQMLYMEKFLEANINELNRLPDKVVHRSSNFNFLADIIRRKKCIETMRLDYIIKRLTRQFERYQ